MGCPRSEWANLMTILGEKVVILFPWFLQVRPEPSASNSGREKWLTFYICTVAVAAILDLQLKILRGKKTSFFSTDAAALFCYYHYYPYSGDTIKQFGFTKLFGTFRHDRRALQPLTNFPCNQNIYPGASKKSARFPQLGWEMGRMQKKRCFLVWGQVCILWATFAHDYTYWYH